MMNLRFPPFSTRELTLTAFPQLRTHRSLDHEEKEPYVRRANLIKAVHKRDYPNYRVSSLTFDE